jgi:hypothetical protein
MATTMLIFCKSWAASVSVFSMRSPCDNPPRKIPYYHLDQSTLVDKQ